MVDPEIVREWLTKAEEDFSFALSNLEEQKPFYAQICFHFHQASEKYLKAYIVAHELEFRKTHDLPLLLRICSSRDPAFDELRDSCEYLNAFYVETRYPVPWPAQFTLEEAKRTFQAAEEIHMVVKREINRFLHGTAAKTQNS